MPVLTSVMLQVSATFTAHVRELKQGRRPRLRDSSKIKKLFSVIVIILRLLQGARRGKCESTFQEKNNGEDGVDVEREN